LKITDPDVIKTGERDLIESIKDDLDLAAIQGILLEKVRSSSFDIRDEALSFDVSGGEIVVHDGQIAFKVNFELKTEISIMFDRKGIYIPDGAQYEDTGSDEMIDELASDEMIDELTSDESNYEMQEDYSSDRFQSDALQDDLKDEKIPYETEEADISDDAASDQLDPDDLLDDLDGVEDEDILGDLEDAEERRDLDPIEDLKNLSRNDNFEDLLKENSNFWGNQEK